MILEFGYLEIFTLLVITYCEKLIKTSIKQKLKLVSLDN